ncbi:MAG: hypothetical protein KME46_32685 [Brasilonema angustatum HA4187-MV1]|jgi:chromosome segregation ATPase|nr:hypothetical protein [Brasilonema angustatum HA4187-MV1]
MSLTLYQAAKEVGRTKATLQEAIKKGKISAKKNEHGQYEIEPAELFRVYPPAPAPAPEPDNALHHQPQDQTGKIKELELQLDAASDMRKQLEARIEDKNAEIDRLNNQNMRLTALLPAPAALVEPNTPFFKRWFGKVK